MGDPVSAYRIKPQGEHSERMKELDTRLEKIERDYAVAVHEADAAASGDDPSRYLRRGTRTQPVFVHPFF